MGIEYYDLITLGGAMGQNMKHYNCDFITKKPAFALGSCLSDENFLKLGNCESFFTSTKTVISAYEELCKKVTAVSKESKKFLWPEFLTLAMSLKCRDGAPTRASVVKNGDQYYCLISLKTAYSSLEKRFLSKEEHRALLMCDNSKHFTLQDFVKFFYEQVTNFYRNQNDLINLRKAQTFLINYDPRDVEWLARRGITNKDLLNYNEALKDLKKYIFLTDGRNCSETVKLAIMELQGIKALETFKYSAVNH